MAGEPVTERSALESLRAALADRYRIEREIGRGGMATVYLAQDLRHGRQVAIKVLHPDLGALLGVERFLAEIRVTAALQHPNLLPLFDSGEAGGSLYYVMPYVEGESLRVRLLRETQLPVEEAVRLTVAIAGALDYAHRRGIVHRDLKPENILLHEGQPLVADFGIALAVSNAAGERMTRSGITVGTPQYMAPEQAAGDRKVDGRADLYALGVILYEMLAGVPPHSAPTAQAVIARIISEKPRNLRALRESVPEQVEWAVERVLAKLPADRFASAREFAEALTRTDLPVRRTPGGTTVASPPLLVRVPRVVLPALAAVAVLALGIWVGSGISSPKPDPVLRFPLAFPTGIALAEAPVPLALSPDGKTLAVIVREDGQSERRVMVRSLNDAQLREIEGARGATQLVFSPDGHWLAFYAGSTLRKVPVAGGSPVVIGEVPELAGASWTRPDLLVVSSEKRLAVIPAAGGRVQPFSAPRGDNREVSQILPLLLSDGKTIVYTARTRFLEQSRLAVATLGDSATHRLDSIPGTAPLGVLDGYLIYSTARSTGERNDLMAVEFDARGRRPRGTPTPVVNAVVNRVDGAVHAAVSPSGTLIYRSREELRSQLVIVEPGQPPQVLLAEPRQYNFPRFSPDGRRVAVSFIAGEGARNTSIHLLDLGSGTLTQLGEGDYQEWTPDGNRIIYSKFERGRWLWWRSADGTEPEELLFRSESTMTAPGMIPPGQRGAVSGVLAPNRQSLIMRVNPPSGGRQLWYLRLGSDSTPRQLVGGAENFAPRISPDGNWLAWYAATEGAGSQVYVTPFPGPGPKYQVSATSGNHPIWAPDGKRLFYLSGGNLIAAYLRLTPRFEVTRRDTLFRGEYQFGGPYHAGYDVAPDGRRFVARQALPGSGLPPLVFVHGWREELRARMAQAPQP